MYLTLVKNADTWTPTSEVLICERRVKLKCSVKLKNLCLFFLGFSENLWPMIDDHNTPEMFSGYKYYDGW